MGGCADEVKELKPSFIDPSKLTPEQLTDPDYRLKQIFGSNGAHPIVCSKCHHCRVDPRPIPPCPGGRDLQEV